MASRVNHYDWLDRNLSAFLQKNGVQPIAVEGIISADGDKCYGARKRWEENGIPFERGVAMYILSKFSPYSDEVRDTKDGWVDPFDWVIQNKERFAPCFV